MGQTASLLPRLLSFGRRRVIHWKEGNVYAQWRKLMLMTGYEAEDAEEKRPVLLITNALFALWYLFNIARHLLTLVTADSADTRYLWGQTLASAGSSAKMLTITAAVADTQCCLTRLATLRLVWRREAIFLKTVRSIVRSAGLDQRSQSVRTCRYLLWVTLAAWTAIFVNTSVIYSTTFVLSLAESSSTLEVCCWTFWWLMDMWINVTVAADMSIATLNWLLLALHYRSKFEFLIQQANWVVQAQRLLPKPGPIGHRIQNIEHSYKDLVVTALEFNRVSGPILVLLLLCTMPFACTAVFVVQFAENHVVAAFVLLAILTPILATLCILYISSGIAHMSNRLNFQLGCISARDSTQRQLTVKQKWRLLALCEEIASPEPLVSLYLWDGHMVASDSLLKYVIECCLHYTLYITLDRYISLH